MADAVNRKSLGDYFKSYMPVSLSQKELFARSTNVVFRAAKEARMVEANFSLPYIVPKRVLYEVERNLMEFYEQNSIRLFPHYPSELFSMEYFPEIIEEAKRIGTVVNGFFNDFEAHWTGIVSR